jgi:hypothetical protein
MYAEYTSTQDTDGVVQREHYRFVVPNWLSGTPKFTLSQVKNLVNEMELTSASVIDLYLADTWTRIDIEDPLPVTHHKRSLVRIHPSFKQRLRVRDCPGLEEEVLEQTFREASSTGH